MSHTTRAAAFVVVLFCIFSFSPRADTVIVSYWDLPNMSFGGGTTPECLFTQADSGINKTWEETWSADQRYTCPDGSHQNTSITSGQLNLAGTGQCGYDIHAQDIVCAPSFDHSEDVVSGGSTGIQNKWNGRVENAVLYRWQAHNVNTQQVWWAEGCDLGTVHNTFITRDAKLSNTSPCRRDADNDDYSPDDDYPDTDCDDTEAGVNPGVTPSCDVASEGSDINCDGIEDISQCDSQIVIDVAGNGFSLTNKANGVNFDLNGDGAAERMAWTSISSDDAWLALDRNGNGLIENGGELFGNWTPQPSSTTPNGFLALAVFDAPSAGGNGNGWFDAGDSAYAQVQLWRDGNHDGVSQPGEMHGLASEGILRISLDYSFTRRVDQWGNAFRYRARVVDSRNRDVGHWAWDVFLGA